MDHHAMWQQEWLLLQQQNEAQETQALHIKLATLALVALAFFTEEPAFALLLSLLGWGLDVIVRSQQQRLVNRLLHIEAALRGPTDGLPLQLHSNWQRERGGLAALLREYAAQLPRPSVLYPYLPLLLLAPVLMLISGS
ncbi:MAG: hypothetical protein ACK4E7_12110 [Permianibacter sp.]